MGATQATQPSRPLTTGATLGRYELIRQVAVGGMAELFLARTKGIEGFEKLVVVKRILPQLVDNQQFVAMFLNEARLAAQLHHPNIAQVYDIGVEQGDGANDYFFSMEYVHGEDLGRIIAAATENGVPLSLDAALTLAAGLCAGLHHAHDKADANGQPLGIVHRDVSPSNVLVSYDGAVKLVDFGIARATGTPGSTTSGSTGSLKGKLSFMSPEQCRGMPLDRRSDLYAVGTILYELTTGQVPFAGETAYNLLNHIVHTDVPPPSTLVAGYPEALEAIVMRALARDPDQRFATARELQGALEDFAHESRLRVSPLVLARLMSTLFPARLEEWERARAAGAFFVEQHVVRTLIESGKTGDVSPLAIAAAAAAAEAALAQTPEPEPEPRDPTSVTQPLELGDTSQLAGITQTNNALAPAGAAPATSTAVDLDEAVEPPPPTPVPPPEPARRVATPVAGLRVADDRLSGARTTVMDAADAISAAELAVGDSTEMVRPLAHVGVRRAARPRIGVWIAAVAGFVGLGVVIAIVASSGGGAPKIEARPAIAAPVAESPAAAPVVATPPPPVADPQEPPPPPPLEPAPPAPVVPAVIAPAPTQAPVTPPIEPPRPIAHTIAPAKPPHVVAPPRPRPLPKPVHVAAPKPAPKDSGDSVFMPVRSSDH